jgi:hypothetical protein
LYLNMQAAADKFYPLKWTVKFSMWYR